MTTLPDGAFAPSELLGTVSARVDGRTVTGLSADGSQYLFLPASADLNKLALSVDTQNCTNPTVELQGSKGTEKLGKTVNVTKLARCGRRALHPHRSHQWQGGRHRVRGAVRNLSALYITSDDPSAQGRDLVDASKSNIATAQMLLVDKDGKTVYDARSRSSRRAATPPSPLPRRSPIRSSLTRRATSSPAGKRSRPGRCWPAITTQRSCTTSSSRILPRRWACRTRRPPTGWTCTMTRLPRHLSRQ